MTTPARVPGTILALGGGGFSVGDSPLLDDLLLELCHDRAAAHGRAERPRVLFVGTASGDDDGYAETFVRAFEAKAEPRVLSLFERDGSDLREAVLDCDGVFVGGGSTLNLLALWRLHGLDSILLDALGQGVVMSGVSAGMSCWFEASLTDAHGPLSALPDGLGAVAGSACPHYDGEPERRPTYLDLVGTGALGAGYAAEDGCGLLFRDGELVEAVGERPDAQAFRVHVAGDPLDGDDALEVPEVAESPLRVRHLG